MFLNPRKYYTRNQTSKWPRIDAFGVAAEIQLKQGVHGSGNSQGKYFFQCQGIVMDFWRESGIFGI